jgi:uncharacterized protein (TIGR02266 family)
MRRYDRKPVALPFRVRAATNPVDGSIRLDSTDLSEGGAFLRADLLFEIGDVLNLEIPLPSGEVLKATGRVARVARKPDPAVPAGMGIEFTGLSPEDRRLIQEGRPWQRPSRS